MLPTIILSLIWTRGSRRWRRMAADECVRLKWVSWIKMTRCQTNHTGYHWGLLASFLFNLPMLICENAINKWRDVMWKHGKNKDLSEGGSVVFVNLSKLRNSPFCPLNSSLFFSPTYLPFSKFPPQTPFYFLFPWTRFQPRRNREMHHLSVCHHVARELRGDAQDFDLHVQVGTSAAIYHHYTITEQQPQQPQHCAGEHKITLTSTHIHPQLNRPKDLVRSESNIYLRRTFWI